MSTIKTFGTVAVMIACFAIIYPRFMHPLVLRAFGLHNPSKNSADESRVPPGMKDRMPVPNRPPGGQSEEMKKHMRHGPHPGMRAAAEMQRQQSHQGGSGRGMMGVVLPMYAIGIILYLVYTLFKVFNKSKGQNSWNSQGNNSWNPQPNNPYNRYSREGSNDRMGFPQDYEGSNDVRGFLHDRQQRQELEALLTRVDDKNVSADEMRVLQKRLEETEAQMTRILQAMQSVQTNVDHMTGNMNIPASNGAQQGGGQASHAHQQAQGNDPSPDLDTYEVVSQTGDKTNDKGNEAQVIDGVKAKEEKDSDVNTQCPDSPGDAEEGEDNPQQSDENVSEEDKESSGPENLTKESFVPEMKKEEDSSVRQRKIRNSGEKDEE